MHICSRNDCSGCSACKNVCPVSAIEMKRDKQGFLYPEIDNNKCVECKKCSMACPCNKEYKFENNTKDVYAFVNNDISVLKESSSGGAFSAHPANTPAIMASASNITTAFFIMQLPLRLFSDILSYADFKCFCV